MKDNAILLLAIVRVEANDSASKDRIQSKSASQSYRDNFDGIFKKSAASATLN